MTNFLCMYASNFYFSFLSFYLLTFSSSLFLFFVTFASLSDRMQLNLMFLACFHFFLPFLRNYNGSNHLRECASHCQNSGNQNILNNSTASKSHLKPSVYAYVYMYMCVCIYKCNMAVFFLLT